MCFQGYLPLFVFALFLPIIHLELGLLDRFLKTGSKLTGSVHINYLENRFGSI